MKKIQTIQKYKKIASQITTLTNTRNRIIAHHFPELLLPPLKVTEDVEKKIQEIIGRDIIHSSVFIASTLGFTKSNWNKTIEKTLVDLGLGNKLRCPSFKNMLRFEKLKHLIFKYLEKKK